VLSARDVHKGIYDTHVVVDSHASQTCIKARSWCIDGTTDPDNTVWVSRGNDTFLVHITNGPSFGNGELSWDVASLEVTPRPWGVAEGPSVDKVVVQGVLIGLPAVAAGFHTLSSFGPVTTEVVQIPRKKVVCCVTEGAVDALVEDGCVPRVDLSVRVLETTNTSHGAEVMVEGSVLLHEEDYMLDVLQRASSSSEAGSKCGLQSHVPETGHFCESKKKCEKEMYWRVEPYRTFYRRVRLDIYHLSFTLYAA